MTDRNMTDLKPFIRAHVRAVHDVNGNPRRVYLTYDQRGRIVDVSDEGYRGRHAMPEEFRQNNFVDLGCFDVSVSDYKACLKIQVGPRTPADIYASSRPSLRHQVLCAVADLSASVLQLVVRVRFWDAEDRLLMTWDRLQPCVQSLTDGTHSNGTHDWHQAVRATVDPHPDNH